MRVCLTFPSDIGGPVSRKLITVSVEGVVGSNLERQWLEEFAFYLHRCLVLVFDTVQSSKSE